MLPGHICPGHYQLPPTTTPPWPAHLQKWLKFVIFLFALLYWAILYHILATLSISRPRAICIYLKKRKQKIRLQCEKKIFDLLPYGVHPWFFLATIILRWPAHRRQLFIFEVGDAEKCHFPRKSSLQLFFSYFKQNVKWTNFSSRVTQNYSILPSNLKQINQTPCWTLAGNPLWIINRITH